MQNVVMAALCTLHNIDEITYWENRPFSGVWNEPNRAETTEVRRTIKTIKKRSYRPKTIFTMEQLNALESIFNKTKYINSECRHKIAKELNIGASRIKVWFQNRRMKEKNNNISDTNSNSSQEVDPTVMSPSPQPVTESQSEPDTTLADLNDTNVYSPESFENHVQHFNINYVNEEPIQTTQPQVHMSVAGMQFYNDNNVYPTQYYPNNENSYNNHHFQHDDMNTNYWYSNYSTYCNFYD